MKTFFKILFILFTLLVVAVAIFFLTFDLNMYKGFITETASKAIGRKVSIDSMEMKLSLIPTIKIRGVKIDNPEGIVSDKPFLITDSIEATLAVAPLFSRQIEVRNFTLGSVGVFLADDGKGGNNWTFNTGDKKETIPSQAEVKSNIIRTKTSHNEDWLSQVRIDDIGAQKIVAVYMLNNNRQSVSISDFSLKQLKAFSFMTDYNGISMKVSGSFNSILDLLQQKPNYAFNLDVQALDATANISANVGNIKELSDILLNINVSGNNIQQTLQQLGVKNPLIPNKSFSGKLVLQGGKTGVQLTQSKITLGANNAQMNMTGAASFDPLTVDVQGDVALTDKKLASTIGLKPMTAQFKVGATPKMITIYDMLVQANLTPIQLKGTVLLDTPKPTIDLSLKSDTLDIYDVFADSDIKPSTEVIQKLSNNGTIIPDKEIDLSALNLLNVRAVFDFPHIRVSNSFAGYIGISGQLNLTDSVLAVKPFSIKLLDAQSTGEILVNAVQKPYMVTLRLKGNSLNLEKIMSVSENIQGASLDFDIDLTSTGTSLKTIMSHLNGNVMLEVPEGVIVNKWFNTLPAAIGIVRRKKNALTFSTTDQESHILCAAVNARIQDGKITGTNNVAIETSAINFLVGGDVNLGTETMDLTITPSLNEEDAGDILSAIQYIKITGTFSEPKATLDAQKAVESVVRSGLSQLVQKVGLDIPDVTQRTGAYQLCTKVLGRQSKGEVLAAYKEAEKKKVLTPTAPVPEIEAEVNLSPKEQFKKQLLQSITDALQ